MQMMHFDVSINTGQLSAGTGVRVHSPLGATDCVLYQDVDVKQTFQLSISTPISKDER